MMDGKLLMVTNVADLEPEEVLRRYKSLADSERGFRVPKSEIEIAQGVPVSGISNNINREQADLLAAMNIRKPAPDAQLSLLQ